jgi:HK97 family phage major capsid protein
VKLSDELVQDASTDLEATIAQEIGTAFGNAEETAFVSGSGTLQPRGLLRVTAAGGENVLSQNLGSASGSILTDLIDGYYKMPASVRQGAVYVVGTAMASVMRKSRSSTGEFLWDTSVVVGAPNTFNGVPVFESDGCPATWDSTTGILGMLLNPSFVTIGDRGGYNLRRLMELYAAEGNTGYIASKRTDIVLTKGKAICKFVAASA